MLKVVQRCRDAFANEALRRRKAERSQELLAVLMYTALTPGRCREYTTLDFKVHEGPLPPPTVAHSDSPNCIHIAAGGDEARMVLSEHKTTRHHGCDHIILSGDSPLLGHMIQHIQAYRPILARRQWHKRLFVVSADTERVVMEVGDCAHISVLRAHRDVHLLTSELGKLSAKTDSLLPTGREPV